MPGFAVIGTGIMGEKHARVYAESPHTHLVAVADLNERRARSVAERYGNVRAVTDYRTLFEDPAIVGVSVATPDHLHVRPVVDALEAGRHVLVEKPLATTPADCNAIIDAARRSGSKIMVNYSHRWAPPYVAAKRAVEDGTRGRPIMAYARKNDTIYVPTEMLQWAEGTTPASFLSSHDIDLVRWYFRSEARRVYAHGVKRVLKARGIDTYDAIQALVEFDGGSMATFESSWIYPNTFPTTTDSFVELVLEQGSIHIDRKAEMVEVSNPESFHYPTLSIACEIDGRLEGAFKYSIEHFVRCVAEDKEPQITAQDGRAVAEIVEAIHRSIKQQQPIHLPLD